MAVPSNVTFTASTTVITSAWTQGINDWVYGTYGVLGSTYTAGGFRTALGAAASGANTDITSLAGLTEPTGFRNKIINGSMRVDKRNVGAVVVAVDNQYTLDRWKSYSSAASKFNVQQSSTSSLSGFPNTLIVTSLSAYSAGAAEAFAVNQPIEGFNVLDLGWGAAGAKAITLSFKVTSSLTGTFSGALSNGTGRSYPFTFSIPVASTWTNISVTIPGDTSGTWLTTTGIGIIVIFDLGSGANYRGTAGAWASSILTGSTGSVSIIGTNTAVFNITGVQLEAGSVATPFEHRPIGTELDLCKWYYRRGFQNTFGSVYSATGCYCFAPISMRIAPTISFISGASLVGGLDEIGTLARTPTAIESINTTPNSVGFNITVGAGGMTTYRPIRVNNDIFEVSAEL